MKNETSENRNTAIAPQSTEGMNNLAYDTKIHEGLDKDMVAMLVEKLDERLLTEFLNSAGISKDETNIAIESGSLPADETSTEPDNTVSGKLSPEQIDRLLSSLGEDKINDLLASIDILSDKKSDDYSSTAEKKSTKRSVFKMPRWALFALIVIGLVLVLTNLHLLNMNIKINGDNPIQYADNADDISCSDGELVVNGISVSVPTDGTEEYRIAYSWSNEDVDYPSVPHAISAIYSDKEGAKIYSISLYRNEFIDKKDIPYGQTTDNWFNDWQATDTNGIREQQLTIGKINGFYIYPDPSTDSSITGYIYNNFSYYFAIENSNGINIYVLEGVCDSLDENESFRKIMDGCIKSIRVKERKSA